MAQEETPQHHMIIVGAGGFGLEVAAYVEDIIRARGLDFGIAGFLDDRKAVGAAHAGYSVLGNTESDIAKDALYIIALGQPQHRRAMAEKLTKRGAKFATLMHPAAYVAATAKIGVGCIIAPFAFVGPEAQLGVHTLVNVSATVGHEAVIGDYGVLAPHANIHGAAQLAEDVFVGSSAVVTNGQSIGARGKVAAGAVVYSDSPADVTTLGNPARFRAADTA